MIIKNMDAYIGKMDGHRTPETIGKMECSYPSEGVIFDFFYEFRQRGSWKPWNELIKNAEIPENKNIREIIVPTVDTAK